MLIIVAYLSLLSFAGMGVLAPPAIRLGRGNGILDHPGLRKIHQESTLSPVVGTFSPCLRS